MQKPEKKWAKLLRGAGLSMTLPTLGHDAAGAVRVNAARIGRLLRAAVGAPRQLQQLNDLVLSQQSKDLQAQHRNPLNRFGRKCFSQTDEDGITLEIVRRLGLVDGGVFAELGVGDGTENNTLVLAALGWRGFWIGGEDLAFSWSKTSRFSYQKAWITLENVLRLTRAGLIDVGADGIDVLSIDLDGNDVHFVDELLSNDVRPKLFIVEYNAKFPPPIEFQIAYDAGHTWQGDDYFGASLATFAKLFTTHGYRLVCCNSHSGANAFFVDAQFASAFDDVPTDLSELFAEPRYHHYNHYGHRASLKTIELILAGE